MKKTFTELLEINNTVANLSIRIPELVNGKFGYSYKRFYEKNLKKPLREYNLELSDIRVDFASIDEKTKALLVDDNPKSRGFQYGKQEFKDLVKAENKLEEKWADKEFEIEPRLVKSEDVPELNEMEKEVLAGVIISLEA